MHCETLRRVARVYNGGRAGLTIRHGTHVCRAPGWKGAPQ